MRTPQIVDEKSSSRTSPSNRSIARTSELRLPNFAKTKVTNVKEKAIAGEPPFIYSSASVNCRHKRNPISALNICPTPSTALFRPYPDVAAFRIVTFSSLSTANNNYSRGLFHATHQSRRWPADEISMTQTRFCVIDGMESTNCTFRKQVGNAIIPFVTLLDQNFRHILNLRDGQNPAPLLGVAK